MIIINPNDMYDTKDVIDHFDQYTEEGTWAQNIDLFSNTDLISGEKVENYIRSNLPLMDELKIASLNPIGISMDDLSSEEHRYDYSLSQDDRSKLIKLIINRRMSDHDFLTNYINRLRDKGMTYLAILQYLSSNDGKNDVDTYWVGFLNTLDISYDGTKILGSDLLRLMKAYINTKLYMEDKIKTINDLSTYQKYQKRKGVSKFPNASVIQTINELPGMKKDDPTSMTMTENQYQSAINSREIDYSLVA